MASEKFRKELWDLRIKAHQNTIYYSGIYTFRHGVHQFLHVGVSALSIGAMVAFSASPEAVWVWRTLLVMSGIFGGIIAILNPGERAAEAHATEDLWNRFRAKADDLWSRYESGDGGVTNAALSRFRGEMTDAEGKIKIPLSKRRCASALEAAETRLLVPS